MISSLKLAASPFHFPVPHDHWERDIELIARFPEWYVGAFRDETTQQEDVHWLAQWRKASPADQRQLEASRGWTFSEWCYWMKPERRSWYWWHALSNKPDEAVVEVSVLEWPFAPGSLRTMLQMCGFSDVREVA